MKFQSSIVLSILVFAGATGCVADASRNRVDGPIHHRPVERFQAIKIRSGGSFNSPHDILRLDGETVTLRQAVLELGGIKVEPPVLSTTSTVRRNEVREVPKDLPATTNVLTLSTDATRVREEQLRILDAVFSDSAAIDQLFAIPDEPFAIPGEGGTVARPETQQPEIYLHDALSDIHSFSDKSLFGEVPDDADYNWDNLLSFAIKQFSAYRERNPSFVDAAVANLRILQAQASGAPTPTVVPRPEATTEEPMLVQSKEKSIDTLIGLTPAKDRSITLYFHPELVYHSAIGDTELADGDFLFAIPVNQTTIQLNDTYRDDFFVPVIGASDEFNSVLASTHATIVSGLSLATSGHVRENEVCVLTRAFPGRSGSERYYLPLQPRSPAYATSQELVQNGRFRPGDSLLFTPAARSPIVYESLIAPVQQSIEARRQHLVELARKRQTLPADGRYLHQATQNIKYYTQSATRTLRATAQ